MCAARLQPTRFESLESRLLFAAGDLDSLFAGGRIVRDLFGGNDVGFAVTLQSDGKLLIAGRAQSGGTTGNDFALLRLNDDGSADTSFGAGGVVLTDMGSPADSACAVAVQSNGKIVVAGETRPTGLSIDFALIRYNADGSLDTTFGAGGKVVTDISGGTDQARALSIMADGRIVVAGMGSVAGTSRFAVARYTSAGQLDTSFDTDGKATSQYAPGSATAQSIVVLSDGSIIAAGSVYNFSTDAADFAAVKYQSNGSLDAGFGAGGWAILDMGGNNDSAQSLLRQSDGKLVLAGYNQDSGSGASDFALVRLNANGSLDASFGTGGRVVTDFGGDIDQAMAAALQSNGQIVVAGLATVDGVTSFGLARYNAGGSLDSNFAGGKVTVPVGLSDVANSMAIDSLGRIVLAGFTMNDQGGLDVAAARLIGRVNVGPVASAGGPYSVDAGASVQLSGALSSDPDGQISSYEWDFDYDGVAFNADATGVNPTFSAAGLAGLVRTVALRVTDNDGATQIATTTVAIRDAAPLPTNNEPGTDSQQNLLVVNGTDRSDCIRIASTRDGRIEVRVNGKHLGTFAGLEKIVVHGGNGNDIINAQCSGVAVELFGEKGNDHLFGSRFNDILVGGDGNDVVFGYRGNDLIVGGMGQDQLFGRLGNDLVVGGALSSETDTAALESILSSWNANQSNPAQAATLGSLTIIDDQVRDFLHGTPNQDRLLTGRFDWIKR
jgi:uncharacterized delta-60 repeat protein